MRNPAIGTELENCGDRLLCGGDFRAITQLPYSQFYSQFTPSFAPSSESTAIALNRIGNR